MAAKKKKIAYSNNSACSRSSEGSNYSESDNDDDDDDDDGDQYSVAYSTEMPNNLNREFGVLEDKLLNLLPNSQLKPAVKKEQKTIEYSERHSYFATKHSPKTFNSSINQFWIDTIRNFINDELDYSNFSHHFIFAVNSIPQMIAVLSIMTFPLDA